MRFPVPVRSTIIALAMLAAAAAQEPLPPGEVLRAALEAQVKGDVEGMLAHFALDRYSTEAVAASRKMLAKAAELASFENFELTIRAVSVGESGQMAVVRAQMSFIMNAPEYRAPATEGVLAVLLKSGNAWKLGSINPDPLLDEELRAPAEEIPMSKGPAPRAAQPVSIKELNQRLDNELNGTHLNDNKLAADMLFAHVGKIPGAGDAAANIYQIANVVYDSKQTVSDFWNHGFTRVGFLNAAQVAVGVAQIVTEQLPGPDTVTDLVAMHLSQMTTNAEVRRGIEQLRPYLRGADAKFNPSMLLLPEGAFRYPEGMIKATDGGEEAHPMGQLVFALVFESPDAMGRSIPFVVSGEVTVPDDMGPLAKKLGGVNTAAGWRIPLDVTPMIAGPASAGPPVLQRFRIDRSQAGAPPLAVWTATCVPGRQEVGVRLVNGETTRSVQIRERLYERHRCPGDHRCPRDRRCVEPQGRPGARRHPGIRQRRKRFEAGAHDPKGVPEHFLQSRRAALAAPGGYHCAERRKGGIGAGFLRPQLRIAIGFEIARGDGAGQRLQVPGVVEKHAVYVGASECGRDL